jgi:ATP-dependent protease ClpP protease subunit
MASKWYAFKNAPEQSGEVELSIYDEIGAFGIGAKEFIADLKAHKGQHIHLRINSPGGEIIEGSAIYNALTRHEGGLTVHIDALAASMASVIAMSGNPVYMADNALLMIHNPWTFATGESDDLRKQADLLDTMKSNLVRAYKKKSGMEEKEIAKLMDEETWLDAVEAVALGFVDAIEDGIPAAASAKEMRARFDKFAKARMQNTVVTETTEVSAPAADPVVEETPVTVEVVESVTDAPVVEEVANAAEETPAVEEAAAVEETKQEVSRPEVASPVAKADHEFAAALLKVSADRDTFKAQLDEAKASEAVAKAEVAELREQMQAKDVLHNALKRSLGIAAAVEVPAVPAGEPSNLIEQLNKLSGADRTEFFRKHRAEIIKQTN